MSELKLRTPKRIFGAKGSYFCGPCPLIGRKAHDEKSARRGYRAWHGFAAIAAAATKDSVSLALAAAIALARRRR